MKKIALLLGLALIANTAAAEEYLYILSARAKLMSAPSFSSATVENVTKGEKLVTLEKKNNRWFKVEYKDKKGWISRLAVSPHPPVRRASRLASNDESLLKNSRRRASTVATTAAVRGLRGDNRSRLNDAGNQQDFETLAQLESETYSDTDLGEFIDSRPAL